MEKENTWLRTHWRPLFAIVYLLIITFDFILAPMLWSFLLYYSEAVITQWDPLTLKSGGIIHATMCAVLGISAYTRGQEKLAVIEKGQ